MKTVLKLFCVLFILVSCFSFCEAKTSAGAQNRTVGIGFILGDPSGLNVKLWSSHTTAFDFTAGWGYKSFWLQGNYVWHDWSVFKGNTDVSIPLYYGLGFFVEGREGSEDNGFGPQAVIGLDFIFKKVPFDIFIEVGPSLEIAPEKGTKLFFHGGLGARFYLP